MPRNSLSEAVDRRLSAADRASDRFLSLQIDLVDEVTGAVIGRFGGLWDRLEKTYTQDAAVSRVIRLHAGQLEMARWFCDEWFPDHYDGGPIDREPVYTVLAHGGRRGGKTSESVWLSVCYAVAVPGSIVWIVLPSDVAEYGEEIIDYLDTTMPMGWFTSLGAPHWRYHLANGSKIRLLSGFTPRKLKKGRADFVFINEAQQLVATSYNTVRAPTADRGGLVLCAANPPDQGDPGTWVADIARKVKQGKMRSARTFHLDPERNPHIDQRSLRAMADLMSAHEYDIQIRGQFLLPKDLALHAWDVLENERPKPRMGDITGVVTRQLEGNAYDWVVGVDVQSYPWTVGVVAQFFRNPLAPDDLDEALLWITAEIFVERGDEVDLAEGMKELGLDFDRTLIVCDASGRWQQQQRDETKRRKEYRTKKGSFDIFAAEGYRYIVPPDRDELGNPDVVERLRAANARIGTKSGVRRVFVDPSCVRLLGGIVDWKTQGSTGRPNRRQNAAHGGDALTYIIWRFFPRRTVDDGSSFEVKVLSRFQGRRRMKGY